MFKHWTKVLFEINLPFDSWIKEQAYLLLSDTSIIIHFKQKKTNLSMYTPQNYQTNRIINRQNQVKYEDIPPPQPLETFELTPNCMSICFMLPFPFFCLGCCTSQTAKFRFDNNNRILHIKSYCGYCFWFGDKIDIPYDDIVDVDARMMPGCYVND